MRLFVVMTMSALVYYPVSAQPSHSPYYASQTEITEKEKLLSRCLFESVQALDDGVTAADKIGAVAAERCDSFFRAYVRAMAGPARANSIYYDTRPSVTEEATKKLLMWRSIKRSGG
jgi:hypothetical protein